jgi:hypothetical protein
MRLHGYVLIGRADFCIVAVVLLLVAAIIFLAVLVELALLLVIGYFRLHS